MNNKKRLCHSEGVKRPKNLFDFKDSSLSLRMTKKSAFTLAEVLITLSILGVVAVIAIPNIVNNFQKRMWVTSLQRWYSDMQNTIDEFVVYNGNRLEVYNNSVTSLNLNNTAFIKFLDNKYGDLFLDSNKSWYKRTAELWGPYSSNPYNTLNKVEPYSHLPSLTYTVMEGFKTYKTKSGALFCVEYMYESVSKAWVIFVDINGSDKKPNIVGRDTFYFYVDEKTNALKPVEHASSNRTYLWYCWDSNSTKMEQGCDMNSTNKRNGTLCAKRIIENGWKMDY